MRETILRVAHSVAVRRDTGTHWGPYATNGAPFCDPDIDKDLTPEHPTPWEDPLLNGIGEQEVCGFSSFDSLREWFSTQECEEMHKRGFHIQVWDVDNVRHGENQVLFSPRFGSIVDRRSLLTIG